MSPITPNEFILIVIANCALWFNLGYILGRKRK